MEKPELRSLNVKVEEEGGAPLWILALLLSFVTLAGVLFLIGGFTPSDLGDDSAEFGLEAQVPVESSVSGMTTAARDAAAESEVSVRSGLDDASKETILACAEGVTALSGVLKIDDFRSLDEFLLKAPLESGRIAPPLLHFRNIHVVNMDGELLRLQVLPPSGDVVGAERMQVKLFATDDENLPVPIPLPESLKGLPWKDAVTRFMNQGDVVFDEVSEAQRWSDDASASLMRRNGRIHQMAIFMPGRELACVLGLGGAKSVCRCLR